MPSTTRRHSLEPESEQAEMALAVPGTGLTPGYRKSIEIMEREKILYVEECRSTAP